MKLKVIYSILILFVFVAGLFTGVYFGVAGGSANINGQIYRGGLEMQIAVDKIASNEPEVAKSFLCSSINTRLVLLDLSSIVQSDIVKKDIKKLREWLNQVNANDMQRLHKTCA